MLSSVTTAVTGAVAFVSRVAGGACVMLIEIDAVTVNKVIAEKL